MKKLLLTVVLAVIMLFSAAALAEEVILPDPGYYFGRSYDGYMIAFDEYPKEEFDAYVKLLTEQYGMQITEEGGMGADEFVFMEKPGVQNTEVFVSCFESEYECGMEIIVDDGITLSVLDSYKTRSSSEPGVIAWDDGRMIADPGDFLGYEIEVTETSEGTNAGGGFIQYRYESSPVEDILRLAEAIHDSPYFEFNGGITGKYYWLLCYDYTGPDENLTALCASERAERRGRDSDFSIYISDPELPQSVFYFYQYPGFTINSEPAQPNPTPNPDDPYSIWKTCDTCGGDGDCNYCSGRGYHWNDRNQDCSVCRGSGDCSSCDGKGRK